jgi:hypothetical protein
LLVVVIVALCVVDRSFVCERERTKKKDYLCR